MPSTTGFKQGDIVLVSFPFTDLASAKRRPAVVISPDAFHALGEDLILAAVTSQVSLGIGSVLVSRSDVIEGTLPKDSIVRLGKIFTLHSSLVIKKLCCLTPARKDFLMAELHAFFGR